MRQSHVARTDTIRGIGFQQALAVLSSLEILDEDDLAAIRVEGVEDIVDMEAFRADGSVAFAYQSKTR
jgi:hypothetical protein